MTQRGKKEQRTAKQVLNIEGGIHAGRDVIQGDQTNYLGYSPERISNIQTTTEFLFILQQIQAQLVQVRRSTLTSAQARNLEAVADLITDTVEEAQKPTPTLERIKSSLSDAKETMDLLRGTITSAATLGTTIGVLITAAIRLFGG